MKKYLVLFFLFTLYSAQADSISSLKKVQTTLTHYYHKLLSGIDNTVPCDANCTHPEIAEIKHNSLLLVTSLKSSQDNHFKLSFNLRGHIRLPKISRRLEITFSKQSNDRLNNKQIDYQNENLITDNKIRVGLRYYFMRSKDFRFYTKLGFKIHSPFGLYQELTVEKYFRLYKDFRANAEAGIYYFINHSYFARSASLTFYKPINDIFLLEQRNEIYTNHDNHHETHIENYLKLHHTFDKKNMIAYWLTYATIDENRGHFVRDWQGFSISYLHYIRKWLYIDTIPRILQRGEHHFQNEFALTLNLGLKLGM